MMRGATGYGRRLALLAAAALATGCGGDGGSSGADDAGSDADTDTDTDGDTDADGDTDTGGDPGPFVLEEGPFTIRQIASGHVAFPDVERLADGTLIVVYREAAIHMVDPTARLVKQYGTADGLDWSTPETLYDEAGIDDRDPSIRRLASGDLALTWFQYRYEPTSDGDLSVHQIFLGLSSDGGESIGEVKLVPDLSMSYPGAYLADDLLWVDAGGQPVVVTACSNPVVEIGGALYIQNYGGLAWNQGNPAAPKSRISFFISDDLGATFTEEPLVPEKSKDTWLQEPALLVLPQGRWIVQARTAPGSSPGYLGRTWQIASDDGGQTWGDWEELDFYGHAPYLHRLEDGTLITAMRELNASGTQAAVSFAYSLDEGLSWSDPAFIVPWIPVELGYPSIVDLADGRLLFVYYQAGTSIRGAIFSYQP
ncbi:MAG TPA: sialidase family protein [Polyangia bacterium]|nr:sialidase family protein [Polyangia bacterium]